MRVHIPGTLFEVSDDGHVYHIITGKCRKPTPNDNGYDTIQMLVNGKRKTFNVHRLVAVHHIPNPDNHPIINHKNLNKTDNRKENLEWCTQKHNVIHGILNGRGATKLNPVKVKEIREAKKRRGVQKDLALEYGVSPTVINHIRNGKTWKFV